VLYTTVSHNSSWEWDISLALLVLGFAGVALGVVVIMGWGPFAYVRVDAAGSAGKRGSSGSPENIAEEGHDPT